MYGHYGHGGWIWMAFLPLLWIAVIGLVVWVVVRLTRRPAGRGDGTERGWLPGETPRETPEEILDRRFASGEIDADAYHEARRHLATYRPRPK
ncbi:SHOCT domain-containing protein [Streptomyces sp. CG1]|uniref:SHOCT domain-containing protein n=1 Tax=Streptomyces sp. CG1 TaxID=1287523 RepID=UPI0034E290FD